MGTDQYDDRFFDTIRAGCQESAAVVAPIVARMVDPATVIDVGCGEGWWGQAFRELGADATGVDHRRPAGTPLARFVELDLAVDPLPAFTFGRFDLAVCLEVAEHLPEERAAGFVAELCDLAPVVLFSAAIPGQGGTGHLNCQWPAWWAEHFRAKGYRVYDGIRWAIWNDGGVKAWYRNNLLLAVDPELRDDVCRRQVPGTTPGGQLGPAAVVHPDLWMPEGAPGLDGGGPAPLARGRRR